MRHISARVLAVVASAGLLFSPAAIAPLAAQGGSAKAEVTKPLAEYKGLTPGDYLAIWWQEVFSTSIDESHPFVSGGSIVGGSGVVFVAGPLQLEGDPKITIPVTVKAGTYLFIPIITVECSQAEEWPFHGEDEAELRTCANTLLDEVSELSVRIDGRRLNKVRTVRAESPLFRYGPLPEDNFLGLPAGTQSDSVAAGYGILLEPFSPGVHVIETRVAVPSFGIGGDGDIVVTVEP